jgi:rhodanese-related sulfurtransferase
MLLTLPAIVLLLAAQVGPSMPQLTINSPELRITIDDFRALQAKGEVLVLDVRSVESYREGHIPGAVSLPLDSVEQKIAELRKERRPIVTYCS